MDKHNITCIQSMPAEPIKLQEWTDISYIYSKHVISTVQLVIRIALLDITNYLRMIFVFKIGMFWWLEIVPDDKIRQRLCEQLWGINRSLKVALLVVLWFTSSGKYGALTRRSSWIRSENREPHGVAYRCRAIPQLETVHWLSPTTLWWF